MRRLIRAAVGEPVLVRLVADVELVRVVGVVEVDGPRHGADLARRVGVVIEEPVVDLEPEHVEHGHTVAGVVHIGNESHGVPDLMHRDRLEVPGAAGDAVGRIEVPGKRTVERHRGDALRRRAAHGEQVREGHGDGVLIGHRIAVAVVAHRDGVTGGQERMDEVTEVHVVDEHVPHARVARDGL